MRIPNLLRQIKADWQDFQSREKTEAPKPAENGRLAGLPAGNPQGPRPVETRHFKNRRRSHGHRREDGPADPNAKSLKGMSGLTTFKGRV
ncbi:MAG: hypothetical protein MZU97_27000 [Bacillus subtilis]|nr:hypothetical protein [Bacillus subtilis]